MVACRRRLSFSLKIWRAIFVVAVLCCASAVSAERQNTAASDRETPPDPKPFLGTWKASFQGQPLVVLTLKEEKGTLDGRMNNFDLFFDKDGSLNSNTHIDVGDAPLLNIRFKSGAIVFTVIEKDQYHPASEWKFAPINDHEGDLTPMLEHNEDSPPGLVAKPIRLTREKPKP
jgi:hypothetical protein